MMGGGCIDAPLIREVSTRRFGWDCHGLPEEYEIDKKLGEAGWRGDGREVEV